MAKPAVEQIVGQYDTDAGLSFGLPSEPFYRIRITPQGEVQVGNGKVPPTPIGGGAAAHPDLAAHDLLGLATQAELDALGAAIQADLDAHAGTPHGGESAHPDLAAHDLLGLATQAELDIERARLDRLEALEVHVEDYGAVEGTDSTTAFQAAADAASALIAGKPRCAKVVIPRGTWIINAPIVVNNPVFFEGVTDYGTRILTGPSFPSDGYLFRFERLFGTSVSKDENHIPGWGLSHLLLDGGGRQALRNAIYTDFFDRGSVHNVRARFFKGSFLTAWKSLRESSFFNVSTWMCGKGAERPVIDLYERGTNTDGHNLLQFTDCFLAQSMGDQVRAGSGVAVSASTARVIWFKGCVFHGCTDWIDAWTDNYHGSLTFTDEGDFSCRLVAENARGIFFTDCRDHLPGRGQPNLAMIEGVVGAQAINSIVLAQSYINGRTSSATSRTMGAVDTAADTIATVGVGVHRHHLSTGSRVTFAGAPPAPLVAGTSYWAIRVSPELFKVATTRANAVAGTAIDLTTAGGSATFTQEDFGVTALNATTDALTVADHRLSTGARVRASTTGGLPAPLAANTDYFAIRVDKDTLKLATTRANAVAGTAIDLTTVGTGSHTLVAQNFYAALERGNFYWSTNIVDGVPARAYIRQEAAANLYADPFTTAWAGEMVERSDGASQTFTVPGQLHLSKNNAGLTLTGPAGETAQVARYTNGGVIGFGLVGGSSTAPLQFIHPSALQFVIDNLERLRADTQGVTVTGRLKNGLSTTAALPAPNVAGEGAQFYDTTLKAPVWSDGSSWKAAASGGGGASGSKVIRKPVDESVTLSTALQDDDHLLIPVGANEVWVVEMTLRLAGAATGDIRLAVGAPAGATGTVATIGLPTNATSAFAAILQQTVGLNTVVQQGLVGGTTPVTVLLKATVTNGATAGNVVLQWAQSLADAAASQVLAESTLVAHKTT